MLKPEPTVEACCSCRLVHRSRELLLPREMDVGFQRIRATSPDRAVEAEAE